MTFQPSNRFNAIIAKMNQEQTPRVFNTLSDFEAMKAFNNEMSQVQRDYQVKEQKSLLLASKVRL